MKSVEVADYFSVHEYGKTTKKKAYIFGGWRSTAVLFRPLVSDLVNRGYACVLFIPKKKLIAIGMPYERIITASDLVSKEVLHRIAVDKVIGVRKFVSIGVSFGTIFASEAAKQSWDIRRLILISPFGDFARHVELWPKHRYFGRVLASQPTNPRGSGEILNKVSLGANTDLLKGKQVLVCYASKDTVIHSQITLAMIRHLNNSGVDAEGVVMPGGHMRGIVNHMVIKKTYRKALG